jgi:riboflavin synthase
VFTGIVEEVGTVVAASPVGLTVAARLVLEGVRLGDSIAVDGTCLTVTALGDGRFTVGLQPETLRRTTLEAARPGRRVNLERALLPTSRLGGHFVQGHVDGTGRLVGVRPEGGALVLRFAVPAEIARYVVEKGFIAVDGISLTVVEAEPEAFTVSLVGYTQTHVALLDKRPGDSVNIEVDILAKYVERFVGARGRAPGLTPEFLAEHGFA